MSTTFRHTDVIAELRSGKYIKEMAWAPEMTPGAIERGFRHGGDPFVTTVFAQTLQRKVGVQIRVDKEVSDDLLQSDLGDVTFDEIEWPAPACEMFFEDPALPTFIVAKSSVQQIEKYIPGLTLLDRTEGRPTTGERRVILTIQDRGGTAYSLNLIESVWDEIVNEGARMNMDAALALTDLENEVMKEALRLALKVFAYISLPQYQLKPTGEITKRMGGKPGWKNRPSRPSMRVIYAPNLHTPRDPSDSEATGKTHRFLGRRGHFKTYRHERYKTMRGKRVFIAPIKVDGLTLPPTKIIVRKA